MITIDSLDVSHYFQYARRVHSVEQTYRAYRLEHANAIPAHTVIVNVHPLNEEMDSLFGFRRSTQPWACFTAPRNFNEQRRSTFAFDRICPSIGTLEQQLDKLEKMRRHVNEAKNNSDQQSEEEDHQDDDQKKQKLSFGQKVEKQLIYNCLEEIEKLNKLINFIIARVGQYLQG